MSGSLDLDVSECNLLADHPAVERVDDRPACVRSDNKGFSDLAIAFVAHREGVDDGAGSPEIP